MKHVPRSVRQGGWRSICRLAGIAAERDAVRAMLRRGEINDRTARTLYTEITLTEALLNGRQARK